jgi:hypothetical protein
MRDDKINRLSVENAAGQRLEFSVRSAGFEVLRAALAHCNALGKWSVRFCVLR